MIFESGSLVGLHIIFPRIGNVDWFAVVVCAVAFIGMLRWKWDIVSVVLGSGLLGMIYALGSVQDRDAPRPTCLGLALRLSTRRLQASAFRFIIFNQLYDFGLKGILRRVDRSDCFSESLLLELLFDRQAEFGELFNISA